MAIAAHRDNFRPEEQRKGAKGKVARERSADTISASFQ
jgi:hypothetical protein